MPIKRKFNLKNLGSWAGIKRKKKNNSQPEKVDKENVHGCVNTLTNVPTYEINAVDDAGKAIYGLC
jgi:hypothetical protein